jgi:hypothetical protein
MQNENFYRNAIEALSAVDRIPKNFYPAQIQAGEEYKHFCMGLAQGYEIDWVDHYSQIMINEFGKPEHFDAFKERHPDFGDDIRNAFI